MTMYRDHKKHPFCVTFITLKLFIEAIVILKGFRIGNLEYSIVSETRKGRKTSKNEN